MHRAKAGRFSDCEEKQEEHIVQDPNVLLTILGKMAEKPDVHFDKLFQKLYNPKLWLKAYELMAPNPGNMTAGIDGQTIDGAGMQLFETMIEELKSSRYKPKPADRTYIPKPNGGQRPLGIPSFRDKLLQTVVKLILEAIYEPTFSDLSHGFRPERSCHTALTQVKRMQGIRWWVEGDIKSFFDTLHHETLLNILAKRITDKRFLHLINQFLKAGYVENWKFHQTYSGTPQGSGLSPLLSNIYLNELDEYAEGQIKVFNKGKKRKARSEYRRIRRLKAKAKSQAQDTGDWSEYKRLADKLMQTVCGDPQDPTFRRMTYVRYADDFLIGLIGSKADALEFKQKLTEFLRTELQLELSTEKTLITNAKDRVRFLGYDIKRWRSRKRLRFRSSQGVITKRTSTYQLALLMPRDKCISFTQRFGNPATWQGQARRNMLWQSELEILKTYNAEIRGFLQYYALADNFTEIGSNLLYTTTKSFLKTIAAKRQTGIRDVIRSMKHGPNEFVLTVFINDEPREYRLVSSTRHLKRTRITWDIDKKPNTAMYSARTELSQRLQAKKCEWCGTTKGDMEVHHVRKLADLKGKSRWEKHMIARRRKTIVMCTSCHHLLHAGKLPAKRKLESQMQ